MTIYNFDTFPDRRPTESKKWQRYPADVLPMWVADMDFASAPEIVDAIRHRLDHDVFGYALPTDAMRAAIVENLARRYAWTISPDDIVFLPGVEPGFNMALKAMLRPGDGLAIHTPVYNPILTTHTHWGLTQVAIELTRDGDRYVLDAAASKAGLDRAKALLFCNPHNPTGKVFTKAELTALAEDCAARDILIISDEIHCDLVFDGRAHTPIASLSPEIAKRTVTLMSASKSYNIAGLKTSFAIITDKALRDRVNAARLGMVDSVNILGLVATEAAFTKGGAWLKGLIARLQANRDHLASEIQRRFPAIRMIPAEGTFLAWLDCTALGIPGEAQALFLEHGKVGFSAGSEFGAYPGHIRLNFGCPLPQLNEALDRMERALAAR